MTNLPFWQLDDWHRLQMSVSESKSSSHSFSSMSTTVPGVDKKRKSSSFTFPPFKSSLSLYSSKTVVLSSALSAVTHQSLNWNSPWASPFLFLIIGVKVV